MKRKKISIILIFALVAIFSQSCKVTEPYYTSVKKLYNVEPGMTLNKVNETLEIQPYDFYYNFSGGSMVYMYKYKHMYHKMTLIFKKPDKRNEAYLNSGGSEYYKEPGNVYMEFDQKTKKLLGFNTEIGRDSTINILKHENTIKAIQKDYTLYNRLNFGGSNTVNNTTNQSTVQTKKGNNKVVKTSKKTKHFVKRLKNYKKNALTLNAFRYGGIGLNYERLLGKKIGLEIGGGAIGASLILKYHPSTKINTSSIGLTLFEYRALWRSSISYVDGMINSFRWGLSYEYRFNKYLSASIGAGIQYMLYYTKTPNPYYNPYYNSNSNYYYYEDSYDRSSPYIYGNKINVKMYLEFSVGAYLPW